ncbi:methyl-accepting chemotaxis protein [Cupriavidus sp. AU9028]|uniref:methyl-accepting chemotaxis protein n=1 Tax=Cupriavidus sp. AU9028 TaxID=2871157 RepID=UPI001C93D6BF|nr:MCP four helix bundle domain-containing protein [Cupriavidus sp. AU9028]
MSKWKNIGIATRLGGAFAVMVLLMAAVAGFGLVALGNINDSMRQTVENRLLRVMDLDKVKQGAQSIGIMVRDAALTEDPSVVQRNASRIKELRDQMSQSLDGLAQLIAASGNPKMQQAFAELTERRKAYNAELDKIVGQLESMDFLAARAGLVAALPAAQAPYFETLEAMSESGRGMAVVAVQEADAQYQSARNLMVGLAAVAAALALGLGWLISRSIIRPAREALAAAEALAQGDLTFRVRADSGDEMGRMLKSLQHAFGQLSVLVNGIQGASRSIDVATREIARGNTDLSQRTEEQAASLEQTAASMEQLTSTVRQNAENARQANQLAVNASQVATEGGEAVRGVVATMQQISQSSAKVSEIISVIEGIAFQTNILALNAAVEAARAGEQGRGFSVVAAEVRTLAQRSASAAKEIGELINRSVEQVAVGAKQVEKAGGTMDDIVGAVRRVTDIMGEISAASAEQSTGIEQVNRAVAQMESVVQQNAALVEEAAAAAESLQQQAATLVADTARFQVDGAPALEAVAHASPRLQAAAPARRLEASAHGAARAVAPAVGALPAPAKPAGKRDRPAAAAQSKPATGGAQGKVKTGGAVTKAAKAVNTATPTKAPAAPTVAAGGGDDWETF